MLKSTCFFSFSAGVDKTKDKKSKAGQGEDYYWPSMHIKGTVSYKTLFS